MWSSRCGPPGVLQHLAASPVATSVTRSQLLALAEGRGLAEATRAELSPDQAPQLTSVEAWQEQHLPLARCCLFHHFLIILPIVSLTLQRD